MGKMSTRKAKKYWLDSKSNIDKIWYGLIVLCLISVCADFFYHKHIEYEVEDLIVGMYGWYGFLGCVFLVLASKILRILLMRPETFYDEVKDE